MFGHQLGFANPGIALIVLMPLGYALSFQNYSLRVGYANLMFALQLTIVAQAALGPRLPAGLRWRALVCLCYAAVACASLARGVLVQGRLTQPAFARLLVPTPPWPPRHPPIRVRQSVPDAWISLELTEGRNRQVRRMTAAVGLPTLRLIRVRIGRLSLASLALGPGEWRALTSAEETAAAG